MKKEAYTKAQYRKKQTRAETMARLTSVKESLLQLARRKADHLSRLLELERGVLSPVHLNHLENGVRRCGRAINHALGKVREIEREEADFLKKA